MVVTLPEEQLIAEAIYDRLPEHLQSLLSRCRWTLKLHIPGEVRIAIGSRSEQIANEIAQDLPELSARIEEMTGRIAKGGVVLKFAESRHKLIQSIH